MKPTNPLALALALALAAGCGGPSSSDPEPGADAGPGADAAAPDVDAALEPTPAFDVSGTFSFQLAIEQTGIRPTFTANGAEFFSAIQLFLTEQGASDSCTVTFAPKFVEFSTASPSNRFFKTVIIAPGASEILDDGCGWDDNYMLAELSALGTVEVGLAQARFAEDRPDLDVYFDRTWPLPNNTANIVFAGGGAGFAMTDGVVDEATRVEPPGGTYIDGLYQF